MKKPTITVIPSTQMILLVISILNFTTTTTTDALTINNIAKKQSNVKIGRVSAGPLTVSEIGFGTWSWGNKLLWNYSPSADEDIYQSYRTVRLAGASLFDTADSYGTFDLNGRAETLLGVFERRLQSELAAAAASETTDTSFLTSWLPSLQRQERPLEPQQVATKFAPYPWRLTRGSMVSAARASLSRVQDNDPQQQQKLTLAQLHWSTANYQPFQERSLWEGIADVYDSQLCSAIGVSNYGPRQLSRLATYLTTERPNVPLASCQIQYSLMTYKKMKDSGAMDACDDAGCRLIAYSPLCLGLLTGKYDLDTLPPVGNPRRQLFRELLPGAQDLLKTLDAVGREYGKSMSQVAINWTIRKGAVPIVGVRDVRMAEENLGSIGWKLEEGAVEELDRAAGRVNKPMIDNIFMTK